MTDISHGPGGNPITPAVSVFTDGTTIEGNGTSSDRLRAIGGGSTSALLPVAAAVSGDFTAVINPCLSG